MATKFFSDGAVHAYFNPYETPYDAFMNYMNVLSDFEIRLNKYFPDTREQDQIYKMGAELIEKEMLIANQAAEIEKLTKKIVRMSPKKKVTKKTASKSTASKSTASKSTASKKSTEKKVTEKAEPAEKSRRRTKLLDDDILELSEVAVETGSGESPARGSAGKPSSASARGRKSKK
jgi:alpha-amylase